MRLSFIFELLLVFVFLAFAASRVIDTKGLHNVRTKSLIKKHTKLSHKVRQQDTINRYCSCNTKLCNCCREFDIPVVSLKGPGCASLQYLNDEKLAISMSFGDRVLTNTTINSRRPRPICMPLPGGVSKFCGRVYNIGRQGQDFNACLGLELKALKDVEAALRVSCFKFGPQGLKVQPSQPLPPVEEDNDDDDDDDDDYDDEDEFDFDDDDDDDAEDDDDDDNDIESADYESFSLLDDDFIDGLFTSEGDDSESTPVRKTSTTTKAPLRKVTKKPLRRVTQKPLNTRRVTKKPSPAPALTTVKIVDVKETKATTIAPIVTITTSEAVAQSEKKPELVIPITNVTINEISDSSIGGNMASPEKDSIIPMQDVPLSNNIVLGSVNISSLPITEVEITDVITSAVNEPSSPPEMDPAKSPLITPEITQQVITETNPIVEDSSTTIDDKIATTEVALADDDEEENEEPVQSLIIKNDDESGDEDEEDDEDDSEESDPISEVVEDVLGVEDEKKEKKKDESKVEKPVTNENEKESESAESKDVVDDIIDGTVDMISFADDSDEEQSASKNEINKKEESDEDDFLDDDDDDDDDDEDDLEDEDEEGEARKVKSASHRKLTKDRRLSRDMWLDRLHW